VKKPRQLKPAAGRPPFAMRPKLSQKIGSSSDKFQYYQAEAYECHEHPEMDRCCKKGYGIQRLQWRPEQPLPCSKRCSAGELLCNEALRFAMVRKLHPFPG
jgi:hypothetical protein